MTASIPPAVSRTTGSSSRGLLTLSAVLAEFASGRPLAEAIPGALGTVQAVLGVPELALWMHGPDRLERQWTAGEPELTASQLSTALAAPGGLAGGLLAVRIGPAPAPVGVLAARFAREPEEEERLLVTALANLMAPELAHEERSRQLEVEVAARTHEIDVERRFTQRIIDSLPVGLYVIDREYRIQAWNRKRETGMQGVSREEALGRAIFEILHRQDQGMLRREFDDVFTTGRIQQYQMQSAASGEERTYRITKIPLRLEDGLVTHVITMGEDVTDWKQAQERFTQAEKLAAIGQLAAGVMHEINNPLATIAACAESLELRLQDVRAAGAAVPDDNFDFLRIIDQEVERCKRIVDGLLGFARPKEVRRERVVITDVLEQTLFLLKHHVRFKKLHVRREFDPTIPRVPEANAEQLVQVFMALLLNAMDAMGERGTVVVRTRPGSSPREGVVVEVVDRGHGIPRSELGRIFEPFYTTKSAGQGTGLGLSICYGIVQEHQGRIEVDSEPGLGSTFRVLLPAVVE